MTDRVCIGALECPEGQGPDCQDKACFVADYVDGMAPRTDATDKGLANRSPRQQYIIMRAHARGLEIELRGRGTRP